MLGAPSDERTGLSFSGPSPVGLATIFYCLRFETSLLVASNGSQGYGGGIRPRLHTGCLPSSKVKVKLQLTVSQSVCLSWCRAQVGAHDQIFLLNESYCLVYV
jgi:hypothetical protein